MLNVASETHSVHSRLPDMIMNILKNDHKFTNISHVSKMGSV